MNEFYEEYVQHLESLLESYSAYILALEEILPENIKRSVL